MKRRGFTLIEIMIAVLFLSIAFFGYVALHSRILHSGQKLEEREVVRAATDMLEALEVGRATIGLSSSINGERFTPQPGFPDLVSVTTEANLSNLVWLTQFPEEFHPGMTETLELAPVVFPEAYTYSWGQP